MNIFGGFAPGSQTAEQLSRSLGSRTVMSGSISRGKNAPSQSLQMMERPLMTPDELKSMPKGSFVVMKTGVHPMRVQLRLFLDWGIRFWEPYQLPKRARRAVSYASKQELEREILRRHHAQQVVCDALFASSAARSRSLPDRGGGLYRQNRRIWSEASEESDLRTDLEDLEE